MTICAAAIAEKGRVIVMISDRLRTFGDGSQLVVDDAKSLMLPGGWVALYAGVESVCEKVVGRTGALFNTTDAEARDTPYDIASLIYRAFNTVRWGTIEEEILHPRLLTRETYNERPSTMLDLPEAFRAEMDGKIRDYEYECELLACGFDPKDGQPHIFIIDEDGYNRAGNFGAIGSGGIAAQSQLIWQETDRNDSLSRVLYELYAAKKRSEMNAYVGTEVEDVDVLIMVVLDKGRNRWIERMPNTTVRTLLERPFHWRDQTPFKRRKYEYKPTKPDPAWVSRLEAYCAGVLAKADRYERSKRASSPTGRVRPSSQLRSGGKRTTSRRAPSRPSPRRASPRLRRPGSSRG